MHRSSPLLLSTGRAASCARHLPSFRTSALSPSPAARMAGDATSGGNRARGAAGPRSAARGVGLLSYPPPMGFHARRRPCAGVPRRYIRYIRYIPRAGGATPARVLPAHAAVTCAPLRVRRCLCVVTCAPAAGVEHTGADGGTPFIARWAHASLLPLKDTSTPKNGRWTSSWTPTCACCKRCGSAARRSG